MSPKIGKEYIGSLNWYKPHDIVNRSFVCGYCDNNVASNKGLKLGEKYDGSGTTKGAIYICPACKCPTFFAHDVQVPGTAEGNDVFHVPEKLGELYNEARNCLSNNCYTAAILIARKMLMNIAVEQGAEEGKKFIEYVQYLADNNYIPPDGKDWVDHIRQKGNEAAHEIRVMDRSEAKNLIIFTEMLLKFIYEFPKLVASPDNTVNKE